MTINWSVFAAIREYNINHLVGARGEDLSEEVKDLLKNHYCVKHERYCSYANKIEIDYNDGCFETDCTALFCPEDSGGEE